MWDDFIQEELRDEQTHKKKCVPKNMTLAGRTKGKEKKDLRELKCYKYGEYGHYSSKCSQKKKGNNEKNNRKEIIGVVTSSKLDDLSRRLEDEDFL